jgi:hypothetical protein
MNGFSEKSGLSDVDFGEKDGVTMKTFDAFRTYSFAPLALCPVHTVDWLSTCT